MKNSYSFGQVYLDHIANVFTQLLPRFPPTGSKLIDSSKPQSTDLMHSMTGLDSLEDLPVLLLSKSDALAQASDWIVDAGFWVVHSQSVKREFANLRPDLQKWLLIMVAIDDFGGITGVIDDLLTLRRTIPDLPVILLSSEVKDDDFSSVRKYVCDATLRLPVSRPRLNVGFCESIINNAGWVGFSMQSQSRSHDFLKS